MTELVKQTRTRFHRAALVVAVCANFAIGVRASAGVGHGPGDFNGDQNVDLRDFAAFQTCYTGPDGSYDQDGVVIHEVLVGPGPFFDPDEVVIEGGDTVRWVWTCGLHNVVSGDRGEHDEHFQSGNPTYEEGTTFDVTFDHAFLGDHPVDDDAYPYFSEVLEGYGMDGFVDVDRLPCSVFDFDLDGDIDLDDHAGFHDFLTGPVERCDANYGYPRWENGMHLQRVAVGDMDRDGVSDLVLGTINNGDEDIMIRYGLGEGEFEDPVFVDNAGYNPVYLLLDDLNNDDLPDIVSGTTGVFSVMLNQGDRTFGPPSSYWQGRQLWRIASGDIDGDDAIDLVVLDFLEDALYVFRNRGSGGFLGPEWIPLSNDPQFVAVADVDGDQDLDLIASGTTLLWVENDGRGNFESPQILWDEVTYGGFVATDLDGDEDVDFAYASYDNSERTTQIVILRNDGSGHLTAQPGPSFRAIVRRMAVAKIDQDDLIDLLVAGETPGQRVAFIITLLNRGNGLFSIGSRLGADMPTNFAIGDVDGDEQMDILARKQDRPDRLEFILNDGSGRFPGYESYDVHDQAYHVSAGDLNGDRIDDLVVTGFGDTPMTIMTSLPGGRFNLTAPDGLRNQIRSTTLFDFDEDGDLDVLVTQRREIRVLLNNGLGVFSMGPSMSTGNSSPYRVVVADMNGDQIDDLVTANPGGPSVAILLGRGGGQFADAVEHLLREDTDAPVDLGVADFDADGDLDLVLASGVRFGNRGVATLLNNGDATFARPRTVDDQEARGVDVADFDMDGDQDFAISGAFDGLWIYYNDGTARFQAQTLAEEVAAGGRDVTVVDFDRDGDPDLALVRTLDSELILLFNDGRGNFSRIVTEAVLDGPYAVTPGDFNGDRDPDLAVVSYGAGTVSVLLNRCEE